METFDCDATITQVMEFCRRGFLVLEGIVPPEIDRKTLESLDAFYATQPEDLPDSNGIDTGRSPGSPRPRPASASSTTNTI